MKNIFLTISFLALTGCNMRIRSDAQACLVRVQQAYCRPTGRQDEFNDEIYDCSAVNNVAYDAAIKICLEKK